VRVCKYPSVFLPCTIFAPGKVDKTMCEVYHKIFDIQYTQGHIVIDVRHVEFDMSDNRSDGDRCNIKGHKTKELSQQV
jgi:hypothetical protein